MASAFLTFVILLIFGLVVGNLAVNRVRSDFNRDLKEAATRLVSRTRIVERPFTGPIVFSPDLADVALPNGAYARVFGLEGRVLDQSPERSPYLGPPRTGIATRGDLTVATAPVEGPNSEVVGYIQYGRGNGHVSATVTKLWLLIVGGILGGTALAILAGLALASRAMRPISALTATTREVATTRDPSRRLPEPAADDEIGELTRTLQDMLNSLDAARTDREDAMQRQRHFLADASHELRTPLTSVLANLELLEAELQDTRDNEQSELVTSAVRSSRRMSRLVTNLLVLVRSDAGLQRQSRDVVDLLDVAKSAAREIRPNLDGRILDIDRCESSLVLGDRDDLHRLILNLLDNAIRYSPVGAQIRLRTWIEGDSAKLEVADSGPGIAPGMRTRVFERFVRHAAASDTSSTEGTGLGLAMVQAIAGNHGGSVVAESSEELGGASIRVSLPLAAARSVRATAGI